MQHVEKKNQESNKHTAGSWRGHPSNSLCMYFSLISNYQFASTKSLLFRFDSAPALNYPVETSLDQVHASPPTNPPPHLPPLTPHKGFDYAASSPSSMHRGHPSTPLKAPRSPSPAHTRPGQLVRLESSLLHFSSVLSPGSKAASLIRTILFRCTGFFFMYISREWRGHIGAHRLLFSCICLESTES